MFGPDIYPVVPRTLQSSWSRLLSGLSRDERQHLLRPTIIPLLDLVQERGVQFDLEDQRRCLIQHACWQRGLVLPFLPLAAAEAKKWHAKNYLSWARQKDLYDADIRFKTILGWRFEVGELGCTPLADPVRASTFNVFGERTWECIFRVDTWRYALSSGLKLAELVELVEAPARHIRTVVNRTFRQDWPGDYQAQFGAYWGGQVYIRTSTAPSAWHICGRTCRRCHTVLPLWEHAICTLCAKQD